MSELRRADAVVAQRLGVSVRNARRLFSEGGVRLDGRRIDKGDRIADDAELQIEGADRLNDQVLQARPMNLEILYEDALLVAINKPAGMPSHPLRAGEGDTVAAGIVQRFPECAQASQDAREGGLAHRLDTGTSGVIVAGRSAEVWRALRQRLSSGQCQKTYLTEVVGHPPTRHTVDAAIGRGGPRGGLAMIEAGRNPLPALTAFETVEKRETTTLVRATLSAGRAHQVRVHLAHSGHPVLGDSQYGDPAAVDVAREQGVQALRLHAESIAFAHPKDDRSMRIDAPPPQWAR